MYVFNKFFKGNQTAVWAYVFLQLLISTNETIDRWVSKIICFLSVRRHINEIREWRHCTQNTEIDLLTLQGEATRRGDECIIKLFMAALDKFLIFPNERNTKAWTLFISQRKFEYIFQFHFRQFNSNSYGKMREKPRILTLLSAPGIYVRWCRLNIACGLLRDSFSSI